MAAQARKLVSAHANFSYLSPRLSASRPQSCFASCQAQRSLSSRPIDHPGFCRGQFSDEYYRQKSSIRCKSRFTLDRSSSLLARNSLLLAVHPDASRISVAFLSTKAEAAQKSAETIISPKLAVVRSSDSLHSFILSQSNCLCDYNYWIIG